MNLAYWLILGGLLVMFIDLTAAGIVQGKFWTSAAPWMDSVRSSQGYWLVRALAALPILLGFAAFIAGMVGGAENRRTDTGQALSKRGAQAPLASGG